jgi:hypothetical protein
MKWVLELREVVYSPTTRNGELSQDQVSLEARILSKPSGVRSAMPGGSQLAIAAQTWVA